MRFLYKGDPQHAGESVYQTRYSAGFDLVSQVDEVVSPGGTAMIPTGWYIVDAEIDEELQIRPRSGLSFRTKLRAAFGTVDPDYRQEICVVVDNIGPTAEPIFKGMRIAQAVLGRFHSADGVGTKDKVREGGFGSTGK